MKFMKSLLNYMSKYMDDEVRPYENYLHAALSRGESPAVANRQARIFSTICGLLKIGTYAALAAVFTAIVIAVLLIFG